MKCANKFRLSKQFYYLKSKGAFLSTVEGDSNIYKLEGSAGHIVELIEKNGELTLSELNILLESMFESYSKTNKEEVSNFISELVLSGIIEEIR